VRNVDQEAPQYTVFSGSVLHCPFLSIIFSNSLSLCSSVSVRDQILYPHKKGKTVFLDIVFFFSASKMKVKIFWTEWQQAFSEFTWTLISS